CHRPLTARSVSLCLLFRQVRGAEGAASGLNIYGLDAVGAIASWVNLGRFGLIELYQRVDWLDYEEIENRCYDQEADDCVEKVSVQECNVPPNVPGCSGKVSFRHRNQWGDDVLDQSIYD